MKGVFFNKPLEWSIETNKEAWTQGEEVHGLLRLRNHGPDSVDIKNAGVALAFADIKKVHARADGALKVGVSEVFTEEKIAPQETKELEFHLKLPLNCPVTDKKTSYFLTYGKNQSESHLMLKVEPNALFGKVIGLLDTFYRFKLKDFKSSKKGVEYKLLPPTSRDMANLESLNLTFSLHNDQLVMDFDFQVKKLDTSGVTAKVNKASVKLNRTLGPKEYSLGRDMINQDLLLKSIESVLSEVKLKSVF